MRSVALVAVRGYQRLISPFFGPRCKYHPTCSEYAAQAIDEYGAGKGSVLAGWRLLRCNPLSRGGVDYPKDQRVFTR